MNSNLVPPAEKDPLDEQRKTLWNEVGRNLVLKSAETLDGVAKQIIAIAGILEGLYFHAITFSEVRDTLQTQQLLIYIAPLALLLISLVCALLVFAPDTHWVNVFSPDAVELIHTRTVKAKYRALVASSIMLVLGIVALGLSLATYLLG